MKKMSEKIYLQMAAPTEEDFRSSSRRITDALQDRYGDVAVPVQTLRKLYPLCQKIGESQPLWPGTETAGSL